MNGGLNTYTQWITLFEHEEDDEYDGEMGINDDETPMLQIRFEICQDEPSQVETKSVTNTTKTGTGTTMTTTTTTTTTQMRNGVQTSSTQ